MTFRLPPPIHTVALGICMDLNPQIGDWTLSHGPYEMADYCLSDNANVLVLLNAWLDSGKNSEEASDWSTLNYWAARLQPLWIDGTKNGEVHGSKSESDGPSPSSISSPTPDGVGKSDPKGKETIVVICNRCGEENGKSLQSI